MYAYHLSYYIIILWQSFVCQKFEFIHLWSTQTQLLLKFQHPYNIVCPKTIIITLSYSGTYYKSLYTTNYYGLRSTDFGGTCKYLSRLPNNKPVTEAPPHYIIIIWARGRYAPTPQTQHATPGPTVAAQR